MAPGTMAPVTRLFDEILEDIFLRLPTPEDLARAAAASPAFRRVITSRPFLRRFREIHPPPLLGLVTEGGGFRPAADPNPSAPLGRAIAAAADFTYAFVPEPDRGGAVLLTRTRIHFRQIGGKRGTEARPFGPTVDPHSLSDKVFAVCDPVSRRHVLLPPLPLDDTALQAQHGKLIESNQKLVPNGGGGDEGETAFKVICWANCQSRLVLLVFSSATGQWRVHASPDWGSFVKVEEPASRLLSNFTYFGGRCYWTSSPWSNKVLVLDTRNMEFSSLNIPFSNHMQLINMPDRILDMTSIVVPTEGTLEMFTLVKDFSQDVSPYLYHTTQQTSGDSSNECQLKTVIELPPGACCSTVGATEGFLFLRYLREAQQDERWAADSLGNDYVRLSSDREDLFSLEVKTSELKKVYGGAPYRLNAVKPVHAYFGFPPPLSKPSL
ncbi:hypothetical protein BRADI_3g03230v3 [Brachypodium distachyon]|uniref:F-box domain-containing protein n=1 Tax=Brachypodium distachyon TaxID=15368 RepID=A0A2K2CUX6_BRADI|nr:hypothetical protein BRADI_3g03230v3 [Brachypodium distachyon]PNT65826.1 hypothetical protein BRADI_3g03230v3 [Brachypodium distachyon]